MSTRSIGPDEAYDALRGHLADELREGRLLEMRREGDEAVLLLRIEAHPPIFGVRVRLDDTTRRLDWDYPATDLDDWLDSVVLWLMEDVENWFASGASRTARNDHVELGPQVWPDGAGGWRTDTRLLDEDRAAAFDLIASSTADGGPWGHRRDQAGRVLPSGRLERLLHRLRHGPTGAPRRFYVG